MSASESNPLNAPHGQTKLDRWMEALFGDSLPKHFGSGWLSGVFGVLLGLGSFLAVLVFRYPQWLTASETAPRYPIETMRVILALAVVASFLLSALNILLRPSKRLGLTGLFFCMAAVLAGGSTVEVGSGTAAFRVGLDWFILNIVLLAVVFIPLERLFPLNAEQGTFRPGWTTDGIYFLISHVAVELLTFFTLLPATYVARSFRARPRGSIRRFCRWPSKSLLSCSSPTSRNTQVHRTFHSVRWLWPFHAVHHSSRDLDWLAGSRLPCGRHHRDAGADPGAAVRARLFADGALHLACHCRRAGHVQSRQHPVRRAILKSTGVASHAFVVGTMR